LVPHSIVDNGQRWHVRAFDRKTGSFRDFVLTRISKVTLKADPALSEQSLADEAWQRKIALEVVPHPKNINHPTAIELDYGMEEGVLQLEVRAAMAGYLLRRWNVDCTKHASLRTGEYQLWLRNQETLENTDNLAIAPGYISEEKRYE
jgi:predicted DNA-binding transcriptional regulator YafY